MSGRLVRKQERKPGNSSRGGPGVEKGFWLPRVEGAKLGEDRDPGVEHGRGGVRVCGFWRRHATYISSGTWDGGSRRSFSWILLEGRSWNSGGVDARWVVILRGLMFVCVVCTDRFVCVLSLGLVMETGGMEDHQARD